jgi:hypothetical protein
MPGGAPAAAGPARQQVSDVDGERVRYERRVCPGAVGVAHLQAAVSGLAVQDRQDAPVGVRGDPELALLRRPGDGQRRVPVDVEGLRPAPDTGDEEVLVVKFKGRRAHPQQVVVQLADLPGEGLAAVPQARALRWPDIGREPLGVGFLVAGAQLTADREALLQVRALRVGHLAVERVRLAARRYPAAPGDRGRVRLLALQWQREERAGLGADRLPQALADPVPADQQEPGFAQRLVHPGGDLGALRGGPPAPLRDIQQRDIRRAHPLTISRRFPGAAKPARPRRGRR